MASSYRANRSIVELIDELEAMVGGAKRVPLTGNVVVNEEEAVDLIDRVRLSLPDEVVQAQQTLGDREAILQSAHAEAEHVLGRAHGEAERLIRDATHKAERMVTEATARAESLLAEHSVLRAAQDNATRTVSEAEERAAATRGEADAYAAEVMQRLEEQLVRALSTVRKGIETLPAPAQPSRRARARA